MSMPHVKNEIYFFNFFRKGHGLWSQIHLVEVNALISRFWKGLYEDLGCFIFEVSYTIMQHNKANQNSVASTSQAENS